MTLKIKKIFIIACFLLSEYSNGQDTLCIVAYNLLNYSSTGANQGRFEDLKTIVQHTKPDILLVCEIVNSGAPQYLLQNSLNAAGVGTYTRAAFFDGTDTDNMLFYKTPKIKLKSQKQILTALRDISQYVVYSVPNPGDTATMYLHMAHLKAGSSPGPPSDASLRDQEVVQFCLDIAGIPQNSNVLLAGDLNLKGSSEAAWQRLTTNCPHLFVDPINQPGEWFENSTFASIHTQSTRSNANPGCCGGSTGGLDDRFDFILTNSHMLSGLHKVKYVPGSYQAFGNDGQHFNVSLLDAPSNSVVPAAVNQALFNMSDHLPVLMKVAVGYQVVNLNEWYKQNKTNIKYFQENDRQYVSINTPEQGLHLISFFDFTGQLVYSKEYNLKQGENTININNWSASSGVYIIEIKSEKSAFRKLIQHN